MIMSNVAMPGDEPNDSGVDNEQGMDAAHPHSAGSILDESSETSERQFDLSSPLDMSALIGTKDEKKIKSCIEEHIRQLISDSGIGDLYNVLFLFDNKNSITRLHSERIYDAVKNFKDKKDILLFLRSKGGETESAYLISKLCNRFKKDKFIVSIPAEAKSAATLLSFGADEIHMGPMSELGPIDIQVDGLPLLSVSSTLNKIASIVHDYPKSAGMFAEYLTRNLKIGLIGYYDRVSESATQYASILLKDKYSDSDKVMEIANHFTNHYKAHGFVVDTEEAKSILGSDLVKDGSEIYELGSKIQYFINLIEFTYAISGSKTNVFLVGNGCEIITYLARPSIE
jgi:hypothetical protein